MVKILEDLMPVFEEYTDSSRCYKIKKTGELVPYESIRIVRRTPIIVKELDKQNGVYQVEDNINVPKGANSFLIRNRAGRDKYNRISYYAHFCHL